MPKGSMALKNCCTLSFVPMASLSVLMETHVVNFLLDNGVVVHFLKLSAVVMEYIVAPMGTPAMF